MTNNFGMVPAKYANTTAAALSFVSSMSLLLVNLGTPIIKQIYVVTAEGSVAGLIREKIIFGIYGACLQSDTKKCTKSGLDDDFYISNGSTKFLLSMHAIGVITSFILFCIGIYARHGHIKHKGVTRAFVLFSSFVILLAMGGQIDLYLKIDYDYNMSPSSGTTKFGVIGFALVIISLVFSFLSIPAFYIGGQVATEGSGIDCSNSNRNMSIGMVNQPPAPQYPPSYSIKPFVPSRWSIVQDEQQTIPLEEISSSSTEQPISQSRSSTSAQPHVHFSPISPTSSTTPSSHRNTFTGLGLNEDEWELTGIPEELRSVNESFDRSSANNTEANSMRTDWKRELFLLLEDPSSSNAAFMVHVFVSFSIVLSAVLTTIETIPTYRSTASSVWYVKDYILGKCVLAPLAIIDFIAIIPYYIELGFHHDTTYDFRFTILRLFRLLRVFKAFKYSSTIIMTIEVMIVAVKRSMDALGALFFFMITSIVLFSTLIYFAERGTWDQEKQIFVDSKAFWFVMVTITTTGYGDMVPTTFVGKLIAFPAMMCGTEMRESFESTQSFASHVNRGSSSMNNEIVNNQDILLQQVKLLMKISHQNQIVLEKIQKTLEQNGINYNPTEDKLKIIIPGKSSTDSESS
nr:7233_t:CDS:10 [Entrophospora candida]